MAVKMMFDLSVPLRTGTPVYPGDPEVEFRQHSTIAEDGFNLLSVQMGSQSGTHVDAPTHFMADGLTIDEVPLERFLGRGVVVDATRVGARGHISLAVIRPVLAEVQPGDIVVFHTGWSRHFGSEEYFNHPFLDLDACQALLERGVLTFGLDALNIDETPNATHSGVGFPVHHAIAEAGGIIIENLTNIRAIVGRAVTISALPLAFTAADGAPVRAVAWE